MFIKHLLVGMKAQKFSIYEKNIVAEVFPNMLTQWLTMIKVVNIYGLEQQLSYDWKKQVQFKLNLGHAIYNENYDKIDDIILEFMNTYHYKILTPKKELVLFPVVFKEEAKNEFINKCNSFKGKEWDNIVSDLIDSIYSLFESATVHKNRLI